MKLNYHYISLYWCIYTYIYICAMLISKILTRLFSYINNINDWICTYILKHLMAVTIILLVLWKICKIPLPRWNHGNYPVTPIYGWRNRGTGIRQSSALPSDRHITGYCRLILTRIRSNRRREDSPSCTVGVCPLSPSPPLPPFPPVDLWRERRST